MKTKFTEIENTVELIYLRDIRVEDHVTNKILANMKVEKHK